MAWKAAVRLTAIDVSQPAGSKLSIGAKWRTTALLTRMSMAPKRLGVADHALDLPRIPQVGGVEGGLDAMRLGQPVGRGLALAGRAEAVQHDVGAHARQRLGHRMAQAGDGARDESAA